MRSGIKVKMIQSPRDGNSKDKFQASSAQSSPTESYAGEQTRRASAAKLLDLLESNADFALDDDDAVSAKSADESSGGCSENSSPIRPGYRRWLRGLLKRVSTRSRHVERKSKSSLRSASSPPTRSSKSSISNLQDLRKDRRQESRHRNFVHLANQLCCTRDELSKLASSDSTLANDASTMSFLVERNEYEVGPSKTVGFIQGPSAESFEVQEQPKKPLPPIPVPSPYRRGTSMVSASTSGNRPTLRRAMSTPALQTHRQGEIRSILKKDDALSSTQPREKNDASVRFDSVEMREFHRTVGDNPSVSCGVPMALDWHYNPEPLVHDLDEYESDRRPRRQMRDLALGPAKRARLLHREWGVPMQELHQTVVATDHLRNQRWLSATQKPSQYKRDEIFETAKRRVGRAFTGGKKKEIELLRDMGIMHISS